MRKTSIQRRLIAAVVVSQLMLAISLVGLAAYFTRRQLRDAFDAGLNGRLMSIAALVRYSEEQNPKLMFQEDLVPPPLDGEHPDFYMVQTRDGHVIARSANWPKDEAIHWEGRSHLDAELGNIPYRGLRVENLPILDRESDKPSNESLNVIYAASTEELRESVVHAAGYTALGSAVLLCVTVALAVWGMRRGLRPLSDLATSAGEISSSNWELRPSERALGTTELAPLVEAMTAMLDGLHRAFTQQREFLANAAHELKTPVAILKSTLQSLLQIPRSASEYRDGLEHALEDMARLEKLMHSMLRLARAEQWASGTRQQELGPVDVVTTCELTVDRLQALAQQRNVSVKLESNGHPVLHADPDDLELVWSNLLENAIRFSPVGGAVDVSVTSNGGWGHVAVQDSGPGIPPSELPRIFERFHRGDASRARNTGGYGLGLAISKALVEVYEGTIQAESQPGQGTLMTVSLPLNESECTQHQGE